LVSWAEAVAKRGQEELVMMAEWDRTRRRRRTHDRSTVEADVRPEIRRLM
jgi:hypothetical protein